MNSVREKAKTQPRISTIKSFNHQNLQSREFQELNELDRFGRVLGDPIEKHLAPFKNLLEVFLIVLKFLVFIGAGMDKAKVNNTVNLIYGLTSAQIFNRHDTKSDLFVQFLEQDRLGLTNIEQGKILIEIRESRFLKSYHQERVSIGSRIEDLIYFELQGISTRLKIILKIILRSMRLMFSPMRIYEYRFSLFQYLVSDVLFEERLEIRINLLITTQSQLLTQPYPFHIDSKELSGKKVMLWYSTNHGRVSKDVPPWELDYDSRLSCMQIDRNLVWNQSEVNRLRKFGVRAEAVGSILFRPKPYFESEASNYQDSRRVCQRSEHNLIIFDVQPRFDTSEARLYSYKNVGIFIAEVLKATHFSTLKINCHVKPKREFSKKSELSDEYLNLIEHLERQGKLSVLNPVSDLYDLVDYYCMAISIPYTSAGYVFYEAGLQACFYTPFHLQDLIDLNFQEEMENMIGIKSLIDWLSKHGL
jgi:polysaccharide biosynthesis PFTS motif protein